MCVCVCVCVCVFERILHSRVKLSGRCVYLCVCGCARSPRGVHIAGLMETERAKGKLIHRGRDS